MLSPSTARYDRGVKRDRYQRAGLPVTDLRRARVTGGGLPVWTVHPLPPRRQPFDSWRRLRAAHTQTGLWPFLVGPDRNEQDRQAISELWYDAETEHDPTAVKFDELSYDEFLTRGLKVAVLTIDPAKRLADSGRLRRLSRGIYTSVPSVPSPHSQVSEGEEGDSVRDSVPSDDDEEEGREQALGQ